MIDYKKFLKKDFTNKYRLLCPFSEFKVEKVAQVKNNNYICKRGTSPQIKIEEL